MVPAKIDFILNHKLAPLKSSLKIPWLNPDSKHYSQQLSYSY